MEPSKKKLAFAGPWVTQQEVDHVAQAVKDGWYEQYDKYMNEFMETVKKYLGVKYAIGTHCCTQALHLACASLGLKEGDEVIVTDHSWVATAYSISYTGAKCVFVDIDPVTLCIDYKCIEKAVTNKTKAIMVVHNFGIPADMDEIIAIAKKYNLKIIEDAAPAFGATYKGKKCGTLGDIGCISFQGAKIAAASEGGIMVTNDEDIYNKALLVSSMGRTDSQWPFWSDEIGYQYTIGSLPAAMATIQVKRIDELVANKRKIYNWYKERLEKNKNISLICHEKEGAFANYTYPSIWLSDDVVIPAIDIVNKLKTLNIHCRPAFPQMSLFPVYKADKRFVNPVCQKFMQKGIVLPGAHNLVEEDIDFICKALFEIISK